MLDLKEIEKQLKGLSKEKCVAFAVRAAMRALPALGARKTSDRDLEPFGFWRSKDREKRLALLFSIYGIGTYSICASGSVNQTRIFDDDYIRFLRFGSDRYVRFAHLSADDDDVNFARIADKNLIRFANDDVHIARLFDSNIHFSEDNYVNFARLADDDYVRFAEEGYPFRFARYVDAAAAFTLHAANADSVVSSAVAAARAARIDPFYRATIKELECDLHSLATIDNVEEFAREPLWSQGMPFELQRFWEAFKQDAICLNAGFEVWLDWYEDRLQGKPIDYGLLNRWLTIPEEIKAQGIKATNAYWANFIYKADLQPLNRVRAIFIGYGEAGKTSLITAIRGEPVVESQGDMTPGIEIREWPVEGSDIKAHFWDFGGQVMAHATHQFFLRERCLYVVVLNARSEINSTEQAEYWLEHVKAFGQSAPVMLVGNKCDQAAVHLDMGYLTGKYSNIVDFYPLSCTQAQTSHRANFNHFKQDFCNELTEAGTHQIEFTTPQFKVLEELRHYSPTAAFLKHQEFEAICAKYGVGTEGAQNREWLLDILDKLGVVIHFPQLPCLDDYVLNPRWLTYGVYTLVYAQQARLTEADIVRILGRERVTDNEGNVLDYPKEKCRFIIDAMQQFKLCYKLPGYHNLFSGNHNTLIIPALLPTDFDRKTIPFQKQDALVFEFAFRGFLPRHIMPELIVNRHEEIYREIVWQHGVLLESNSNRAFALLQVDYHNRVLSVWVWGREAKEYLGILRDEVLTILRRLELDYKELINLPKTACRAYPNIEIARSVEDKAPYRQIVAHALEGKMDYISEEGFTYDVGKVLGIMMSDADQAKAGIHYHSHQYGDTYNMSATIQNSFNNSNFENSLNNSFNTLQTSKAEPEAKQLLEQLLTEIKALNAKVPDTHAQTVIDMADDAGQLITETNREQPRLQRYTQYLGNIKEAAEQFGEIAKPIIDTAKALAPLFGASF